MTATTPTPTGTRTPTGIAIARRFDSPVAETWAWITDPDRTAQWFGRWSGDPASGAVEVLDAADPTAPVKEFEIHAAGTRAADGSVIPQGSIANSVAVPRGCGSSAAARTRARGSRSARSRRTWSRSTSPSPPTAAPPGSRCRRPTRSPWST